MDILIKVIQLFLCFTLLVGIHELGHFLMARVFGIRVEKFYIFFDPWFSLFKFKRGGTEYGVGWLPLGGYVKIAGMIDESLDTEQMKQPVRPDEFRAKPAWQRFLVMIAGIVMNILLAVAIYCGICYTWGEKYFANEDAVYGYTFNTAAQGLGFENGDKIISIDGEPIDDVNAIAMTLLLTESDRTVVVERDGRECGCGRKGCLVTYVSATGIKRTAFELMAKMNAPSKLRGIAFEDFDASMISAAAEQGDPIALEAFRFTGEMLGRALADVVTVTSPEAIFLFGGLSKAGKLLFDPTQWYMEENMLFVFKNKVKLLPSGIQGKNAAILGASALIWQEAAK